MKNRRKSLVLAAIVAISVLASACGSTSEVAVGSGEPDPGQIKPISEQNLEQARSSLNAARTAWENREPAAYLFRSGIDTISMIEIAFDAQGNPSEETVVYGEADPAGWASVPRTVDEAFDEIETLLVGFESGQWEVPSGSDCGYHFRATFDPELGAPTYYDTLGPCDDGVGVRVEVIPEGAVVEPVDIPAAPCGEGDYYGTWRSTPEDGGEGVSLTLADGGSTFQNADGVQPIGEWFCSEGKLIAIHGDGGEWIVAAVNDDGTLTAEGQTLTR